MSLILGLHLARRFYLVSDTRVTYSSGKKEDNMIKAIPLNKRISCICAGSVKTASFIISKLKSKLNSESNICDLKLIVKHELKSIISEYVNGGGIYGKVAIIIGGFDLSKKKKLDTARLGQVMSADLFSKGGNAKMQQNIDMSILRPLTSAILKKGELKKGEIIETELPNGELLTLEIDVEPCKYELKCVPVFNYAIYHPKQKFIHIEIPDAMVSRLEFGEKYNNWEERIYSETEILNTFVTRCIKQYKFDTVGGFIFSAMLTPEGLVYPAGTQAYLEPGESIQKAGNLVMSNGKFMYKDNKETLREFIMLEKCIDNNKLSLDINM